LRGALVNRGRGRGEGSGIGARIDVGGAGDGGFAHPESFLLLADFDGGLVFGGVEREHFDAVDGGVNGDPTTALGLVVVNANQRALAGAADAGEFVNVAGGGHGGGRTGCG